MNRPQCTILVADDDKYIRDDLADVLKNDRYRLLFATTAKETLETVLREHPDLVLLDIKFPDCADLSVLQRIRSDAPDTAVIMLTSQTENIAQIVSAIKIGAYDFVPKPFISPELMNRVEKALDLQSLNRSHEFLVQDLEEKQGLQQLVGESSIMHQTRETITKLAEAEGCVLIRGETGTGKEVTARALHYLSRRRTQPFVTINCASIPEALVESVLFGHRRGAFTGAVESAKGRFEIAEEGTVFLDEIGDMPVAQQTALLRVLEYRTFTPVGESKERVCKARFILATNRDLRDYVAEGKFREDLFYRINVACINLPALRNRPEDIPYLVEYYRKRLCAEMGRSQVVIAPEVIALFQQYDWPGNVREMKHILEGALMLVGPKQQDISMRDLPPELLAARTVHSAPPTLLATDLREKEELIRALQQCCGNQTHAARMLGLHRNTIRARIRYFGISSLAQD